MEREGQVRQAPDGPQTFPVEAWRRWIGAVDVADRHGQAVDPRPGDELLRFVRIGLWDRRRCPAPGGVLFVTRNPAQLGLDACAVRAGETHSLGREAHVRLEVQRTA